MRESVLFIPKDLSLVAAGMCVCMCVCVHVCMCMCVCVSIHVIESSSHWYSRTWLSIVVFHVSFCFLSHTSHMYPPPHVFHVSCCYCCLSHT